MNLDHYAYFTTNDFKDYEFYSIGPKGRIKKTVLFTRVVAESTFYNLAFGDIDPDTGLLDDTVITDNNDRDLVLATVANTINDFSEHYGNHFIYAEGSTPSRTRLYQISIAALWEEISLNFDVYGFKDSKWHKFQKNVNYEAFFVKRK
jgi:uncharacterized protein DUF6934